MKYVSGPYFEPDFDPVLDRFGTPGVVVDNETREDCTLVKVDSVNRDGVLLEMVQLLTDLDLVISKSYISSDGGWLMDVFHVTDMQYVVFHATVGSQGPLAIQEYYIRHKDGRTVDSNAERQKVSRCLVAAVERRASHGVRVEVRAADRSGLLSDFTRILREHGLSLLRVELKRQKDEAVGTFYLVTDSGGEVRPEVVRAVRARVGEMGISLEVAKEAPGWPPVRKTSVPVQPAAAGQGQEGSGSSLGSLLWSHLGKLSNNFGYIRS